MNSICYPAFLSEFHPDIWAFLVPFDFNKLKQVVQIAHIQYFTVLSKKLSNNIEKTAWFFHAVIAFNL